MSHERTGGPPTSAVKRPRGLEWAQGMILRGSGAPRSGAFRARVAGGSTPACAGRAAAHPRATPTASGRTRPAGPQLLEDPSQPRLHREGQAERALDPTRPGRHPCPGLERAQADRGARRAPSCCSLIRFPMSPRAQQSSSLGPAPGSLHNQVGRRRSAGGNPWPWTRPGPPPLRVWLRESSLWYSSSSKRRLRSPVAANRTAAWPSA
jgi:hypothetical protein